MASKKIINALENLISEVSESTVSPERKLKILMVGAEAMPYAKVGGFSSVILYLSKALYEQGHDVRIFMPKFGFIDQQNNYDLEMLVEGLQVPTDNDVEPYLTCNVKMHKNQYGITTYFLENMEYYEKRNNVYGYSDDPIRWGLLCRGALEFIKKAIFLPDVVHTNDWHSGLVSNYIKTSYKTDNQIAKIATLHTIHSIAHQGHIVPQNVSELEYDDGQSGIPSLFDTKFLNLNFMRRGIINSDAVNTVSKTYAKEILTEEFGEGLDKLLLEVRSKLFGIVNGIDYEEFDPSTDKYIQVNYSVTNLHRRLKNKLALQDEMDLPVDENIPVFGFVGRLDYQKGVDLLVNTLEHALKEFNMQFVQVGGGDSSLVDMLKDLKQKYPQKVGIHTYPNFLLPRLFFAGTDVMLYPSRFEPCGIVQLEAMRYGSIPLVRKVGGLVDTVFDFDSISLEGTGFILKEFSEMSLMGQIARVLELYKNKPLWLRLQQNAMRQDYSWNYSAKEYVKLYLRAIDLHAKPYPKEHSSLS
jgi:starch synthase